MTMLQPQLPSTPETKQSAKPYRLHNFLKDTFAEDIAADVRAGLTNTPKSLPSKYLYDARGSELFERIFRLERPPWRNLLRFAWWTPKTTEQVAGVVVPHTLFLFFEYPLYSGLRFTS